MTDELERRMRAADPAPPSVPVDPARSPRARTLVEHIMNEPVVDTPEPPTRSRTPWLIAAAAVLVLGVIGVVAFAGGDDSDPAATEPVALTAIVEDPLTTICIELTAETMADAPIDQAFRGTVASVEADVVTLDVDEWFAGGDADTVTVTAPDEADIVLLGGIELEEGGTYLVSAADGAVLGCGFSGEATTELEAIYAEVFG